MAARWVELGFNIEQQNLLQLRHRFGCPVVVPHEHFARPQPGFTVFRLHGFIAKRLGHRGLQIKHQPVFAPLGNQVQAQADALQDGFVAPQLLDFKGGGQTLLRHVFPSVAQARGFGHPQHRLQVSQTAGGFFAIGL